MLYGAILLVKLNEKEMLLAGCLNSMRLRRLILLLTNATGIRGTQINILRHLLEFLF
jgi:hypothetical protein